MKRYIIPALVLLLSVSGAKAQTVLLGDANGDGKIDVADVSATVGIVLGKAEAKTVTTSSPEAFIRENSLSGSLKVNGVAKTYNNGYEYVDLGLSSNTLWCATNVGGFMASDKGTAAEWSDAAALLPTGWSLPTEAQIQELLEGCSVTVDGQNLKVANKTDASKYILIPADTPELWSATEGTALTVSAAAISMEAGKTGQLYIRPVAKGTGSVKDSQIGQGEDNADTYVKQQQYDGF